MSLSRSFVSAVICACALTAALRAQGKLAIDRLALHQYEDGPILASGYEFLPGETGYFSCRIAGFQAKKNADDQRSVTLSWQARVVDPAGVLLEKPQSGRIEERLQPEDKEWRPKFLMAFEVPPFAPGGDYRIPVLVKDELAGAEVGGELVFHVRRPAVEPADSLLVRGFRFTGSEDDATELRPAVYRPGSVLWARFEIAGHTLGEGNRYSVAYGLAILDAAGKQVFAQPEAASEAHASFYPRRVVPGALSLTLDPNVPRGEYTMVVTVRDQIGMQVSELKEGFRIQ